MSQVKSPELSTKTNLESLRVLNEDRLRVKKGIFEVLSVFKIDQYHYEFPYSTDQPPK